MKLTVNTQTLQTMVAKSMKGASCNKMIPLTSFMAINLKDNKLSLITTDATNYLYISEDKIEGEDFYVVVQAEMFSKLISKMTCEKITLELVDNILKVKGNGNYSIELPLNEEGELVKFPDPLNTDTEFAPQDIKVNLSTIRLILDTAKSALSVTDDILCYTGYYVGDKIIATDTYKICGIDIKLFDEPALISPEMMTLLENMTDETINVVRKDTTIIFSTPNCVIYGKLMDCIEDYQVDAIGELLTQEFESSCKVSKNQMLQLLDRLSLFVSPYDKNGIYLTFTRDGLQVESKKSNSTEILQYSESKAFKDFTCCIDIDNLKSQIKAYSSESVEIQYGQDNAIKLIDGNITQIVALLDDDRVG